MTGGTPGPRFGVFHRPSVTSLVWATLDLTVAIATVIALRFRVGRSERGLQRAAYIPAHQMMLFYIAGSDSSGGSLARSYGLYGPILNRSGLHEQRMTVQASLTAGLLLCGTLYLRRAEMVSREVVVLTGGLHHGAAVRAPGRSGARWSTTATARAWRRATC
jgi:hypothetical protein